MPRGDRTGPDGRGSMTGRGLGFCAGYDTPGYANPPRGGYFRGRGYGRGYGRGPGRGYGRGWGYRDPYPPPVRVVSTPYIPQAPLTKEAQIQMLKQEKQYFESEVKEINSALDDISKRIDDLEKE
jgi:hypothetical protein